MYARDEVRQQILVLLHDLLNNANNLPLPRTGKGTLKEAVFESVLETCLEQGYVQDAIVDCFDEVYQEMIGVLVKAIEDTARADTQARRADQREWLK